MDVVKRLAKQLGNEVASAQAKVASQKRDIEYRQLLLANFEEELKKSIADQAEFADLIARLA